MEFAKATAELRKVCGYPIISDGGAGGGVNGEIVSAPKGDRVETTAAGDTLIAEWCWRVFGEDGSNRADRVDLKGGDCLAGKWAVAAGSAACRMPGGTPPSVAQVAGILV